MQLRKEFLRIPAILAMALALAGCQSPTDAGNGQETATHTVTLNFYPGRTETRAMAHGQTFTPPVPQMSGLFPAPLPQSPAFLGWRMGDATFDPAVPVTSNITLDARWDETAATAIDLGGVAGNTVIHRAFAYLNAAPAGTCYILALGGDLRVGGGALVLGADIALRGHDDNDAPVVKVPAGGTLVMRAGSAIRGNATSDGPFGGGVTVHGTFIMEGGAIHDNSSAGWWGGGGVFVLDGTFTMQGGAIHGNSSARGGGVSVHNGTFTMEGGAIHDNSSAWDSGGVSINSGGTFIMKDGAIHGNSAARGGGVNVFIGTFIMEGGTIHDNYTVAEEGWGGGGVFLNVGTLTMRGGAIHGNSAARGGGVDVFNGTFIMESGIIHGNSAEMGGGVNVGFDRTFQISNGVIYGTDAGAGLANTATQGGGALNGAAQRGTFDNGTFTPTPNAPNLTQTNYTIRVQNGQLVDADGNVITP